MNPSIAPQYAVLPHGVTSLLMVIVVATIALLYGAYVPKSITITSNGYVSEVVRARLAASTTAKHVAALSVTTLYAEIKKIISSASTIVVSHDRPGHVTLFIDTMTPCAVVNGKDILTKSGVLVPLDEYGTDTIHNLARITVAEPFFSEKSRMLCSAWIAKLPAKILASCSITWYARSHIELSSCDGNSVGLVFITWCYTDFSPEIMAVMERVAQNNKRIDLRVPHYAIVSPILRGNL